MNARVITLAAALFLLTGNTDGNFNLFGYRIAHYRGPVTRSPEGAPRIAVDAAISVWRSREAIFVDVLPAEGAVVDARNGQWRLAEPHSSVPGTYWFPGAGSGELSSDKERWFHEGMERLSRGRKDRMTIVFCQADCWLSWNAARRLASYGYSNVWWLAEGTNGWREAAMPLAIIRPQPISGTSDSR